MRLQHLETELWPKEYVKGNQQLLAINGYADNSYEAAKAVYDALPLFSDIYIKLGFDSEWGMYSLEVYHTI